MKKYSDKSYLILLFLIVLLSSCSITGIKYMSGYHIKWNYSGSYAALNRKAILKANSEQDPLIAAAPNVLPAKPVKQIMPSHAVTFARALIHTPERIINVPVAAIIKSVDAMASYHPKDAGTINNSKAALSLGLGVLPWILPVVLTIVGFAV